jgi:hypothetical protein
MPSDAPDARLSIPEAFQRLLQLYGSARVAGQRFDEALRVGDNAHGGVRLWAGDTAVDPEWYARHMRVRVRAVSDDQWSAELEPTGVRPVELPSSWSVSATDIDALIRLEQEAAIASDRLEQELKIIREALITLGTLEQNSKVTEETLDKLKQGLEQAKGALDKLKRDVSRSLPAHAKRGRKPYDWELYRAKFYLMLDDDDVPAHADINVSGYADRLMSWGRSNFGEKETPEQAQMRENVANWKPLWGRLKNVNKSSREIEFRQIPANSG